MFKREKCCKCVCKNKEEEKELKEGDEVIALINTYPFMIQLKKCKILKILFSYQHEDKYKVKVKYLEINNNGEAEEIQVLVSKNDIFKSCLQAESSCATGIMYDSFGVIGVTDDYKFIDEMSYKDIGRAMETVSFLSKLGLKVSS